MAGRPGIFPLQPLPPLQGAQPAPGICPSLPLPPLTSVTRCAGRPGIFPEADKDTVIQIANHVTEQGSSTHVVKNVFTLKECAPISGAQVWNGTSRCNVVTLKEYSLDRHYLTLHTCRSLDVTGALVRHRHVPFT